jgi:hypothetical protein
VNPDRRSHVIGAAVIGGLVVLAAGFGVGYAASSDDSHHGPHRMERGGYFPRLGPGQNGQFPGQGNGNGPRRNRGGLPQLPSTPATPAIPSPTGTS